MPMCCRRYAFAAGTTDGPGMFGFHQGTTTGNPFWDKVAAVLSKPTEEEVECQAPKPILLNTGFVDSSVSCSTFFANFMKL